MVSKGIILPELPFLAFPIVSILIFVLVVPAFALEQNGVIEMPFTENPPVVDGKFTTTDEWKDASETLVENDSHKMVILAKHDRDQIYIMLDMITYQTSPASNEVLYDQRLCFDTNNDGGNPIGIDDICIDLLNVSYADGTKSVGWDTYSGDGKGSFTRLTLQTKEAVGSFNSANDPYESGRDHEIAEFKIPISFLHKADRYGFKVFVAISQPNHHEGKNPIWDNRIHEFNWPANSVIPDASTWGSISDSENKITIPPIPLISISTDSMFFSNEEISEKSQPKIITISNQGTAVLKISNIRASGEFSILGVNTPIDIQPSQSVSFDVVFAPITIGEKSGMMTISSNDLSKPTITIDLAGKGVEKGTSPLGGGCLIATATFGSELAPQVQLLRELRDNAVLGTASGTSFMAGFNQFYYSFSPTVADLERQNPVFKELVKITITPMLSTLVILNYVDIDSEQEMLGYGIGIMLMNIGIYFVAPIVLITKLRYNFKTRLFTYFKS